MPGENEKVQAFAPQGIENAGVDISFTVPANGWSENSPYTYTWTNSNILSNSRVTVGFASGNSSTDIVYLDCEKVTGGIQLTSSVKPSATLYLVAHIINAKMDSYADVHGDMVATDIITGTSNVDEALENLDTRVDALNSKIINLPSIETGSWTPTFTRDTATNLYAAWQRIGNILFITAVWNNAHGSGASFVDGNSLPTPPTGYVQSYAYHGTWRSNTTDTAGEIGQYGEGQNMRFSKGGNGVELPNEPISFNAFCFLRKT